MNTDEYKSLDGLGLADLVRRKEVSSRELVDCAIDLAEKYNGVLNAIAFEAFEQARSEAEAKAEASAPYGPFDGVPFFLKDLAGDRAGWPTTMAVSLFAEQKSPIDDTLTQRFLQAGVVPLGKSTTPEMGLIPVTESRMYGDTVNPWDTSRTPGGSSGGSAALVAAGVVPIAHANDGGGSIRIPASCCGLVGHKPSRGLTPAGPVMGEIAGGMGINHIVSRSVRDSAAMLDAIYGPEAGDPYAGPTPERGYLASTARSPGPLRIAISSQDWTTGGQTHPECVKAVERAGQLLEACGHMVEETLPDINFAEMAEAFARIWPSLVVSGMLSIKKAIGREPDPEMFEPSTWALYEHGKGISGGELLNAFDAMRRAGRIMGAFHQTYDVLVTPTLGSPPIKIGAWDRQTGRQIYEPGEEYTFVHMTGIQNATGQPSMSLPLHIDGNGLPVGVMLTAAFGADELLFSLASQLERAAPWAHAYPNKPIGTD